MINRKIKLGLISRLTFFLLFFSFFSIYNVSAYTTANSIDQIYISLSIGGITLDEDENLTTFSYAGCMSRAGRPLCESITTTVYYNWTPDDWKYERKWFFDTTIVPQVTLNILNYDGTVYKGIDSSLVPNSISKNDTTGQAIVQLSIKGLDYRDLDDKLVAISSGGGYTDIWGTGLGADIVNITIFKHWIIIEDEPLSITDNNDFIYFNSSSLNLSYTYNYSRFSALRKDVVEIKKNSEVIYSESRYNNDNFGYNISNINSGDWIDVKIHITGQDSAGVNGAKFEKRYIRGETSIYVDPDTGENITIRGKMNYDLTHESWNNLSCDFYDYENYNQTDIGTPTGVKNYTSFGLTVADLNYGAPLVYYRANFFKDYAYLHNYSNKNTCVPLCVNGNGLMICGPGHLECPIPPYTKSALTFSIAGPAADNGVINMYHPLEAFIYVAAQDTSSVSEPIYLNDLTTNKPFFTYGGVEILRRFIPTIRYRYTFYDDGLFVLNFTSNTGIVEFLANVSTYGNSSNYSIIESFTPSANGSGSFSYNTFDDILMKLYVVDLNTMVDKLFLDECEIRLLNSTSEKSDFSYNNIKFNVYRISNDQLVNFSEYDQVIYYSELRENSYVVGYNGFSIDYDNEVYDSIHLEFFINGTLVRESAQQEIYVDDNKVINIYTYEYKDIPEYNLLLFKITDELGKSLNNVKISILTNKTYYNEDMFRKIDTTNIHGFVKMYIPFSGIVNYSLEKENFRTIIDNEEVIKGTYLVKKVLIRVSGTGGDGGGDGGIAGGRTPQQNIKYFEDLFADYGITRTIIGFIVVILVMVFVGNETKHTTASGYISFVAGIFAAVALTGSLFSTDITLFIIIILAALLTWQFKSKLIDKISNDNMEG